MTTDLPLLKTSVAEREQYCARGHLMQRNKNGTDTYCPVCKKEKRCVLCGVLWEDGPTLRPHPRCRGCYIGLGPGHICQDAGDGYCADDQPC